MKRDIRKIKVKGKTVIVESVNRVLDDQDFLKDALSGRGNEDEKPARDERATRTARRR